MKKLVSLLLALTLLFSVCPAVLAAEAGEYDGKTVILHTNDVHGAIEGYATVAALKADYEEAGAEVILVDAGDYSQGTTYVSTTKGADAISMMNAVGYDFATIGNHEFDYGYAQLMENMANAEFTVLCADVLEDGETIFDASYTYTTESGLTIGFFGMETPEAQTKANPALIQGLTFLAGEQMFACAQAQVDALADADLVVCLSHLGIDVESTGNRSIDMLKNVTGIDLLIDGHSHSTLEAIQAAYAKECPELETKVTSTGTAIAAIGVVVIDDATKTIESVDVVDTAELEKDEDVAAAAKVIVDRVNAEYGEVFAQSEVTLNGAKAPNGNRDSETNNGDLICDAMIWQVMQNKEGLTVDDDMVVAITNGGGIRAAINPGDVSKKDINTVLPFGNTVAVVYVTGAELLEALEASTYCTPEAVGAFPQVAGMKFTINTAKAYDANEETYPGSTYYGPASINRVTIDSVNGKAFDPTATYAVVTNNFCAAGGDTYYIFKAASAQFDTGVPLDEAVMGYVTEELGGVIGKEYAEPQGRITIISNPFTDVPNNTWFSQPVFWAVKNSLVTGRTATIFDPAAKITRQEAVTFLYRYMGDGEIAEASAFADQDKIADYAKAAVAWGKANGILTGDEKGNFRPNDVITRQDAVTLMYRLIAKDTETTLTSLPYADASQISAYAQNAVSVMTELGLVSGTGANFEPLSNCTRAQFVTLIYNVDQAA